MKVPGNKNRNILHKPVMVNEVMSALHLNIRNLHANSQKSFVDATVGTGGYTSEIVKLGGKVLGIDIDSEILAVARRRLEKEYGSGSFSLIQDNFRNIDKIAKAHGFDKVDGIIFDLGVSSIHLTDETRGFSFAKRDTPLDMRLDRNSQGITAADLLKVLREDQLRILFGRVLKIPEARKITREVLNVRQGKEIKTVGDFIDICRVIRAKPGLNIATLPFLALRIAVNSELENLTESLPKAFEILKLGGRLVVITFHSEERKIMNYFFEKIEKETKARIITQKPVLPIPEEVIVNPGSRSANLWVLEKV